MRAECARGELSMLHPKNARRVDRMVRRMAARFDVRILQYANVGNHLHILIKAKTREDVQNFLRAAAGSVARVVKGIGKFWDYLAFSVIVRDWFEHYRRVRRYIIRNFLEAQSLIPYDRSRPLFGLRLGPAPIWSWRPSIG
jgi:REP element-mobilizing transposase RayT